MSDSETNPSLTILRGAHDANMTNYVLPYFRQFDLLFLELPGKREQQVLFASWANSITLKSMGDARPIVNVQDFTTDESSVFIQLIRRLKNRNVLVYVVDQQYDKDIYLDEYTKMTAIIHLTVAQLDKADIGAMRKSVEARASARADTIVARDKLVATQVTEVLGMMHSEHPDRALHGVLIQGYDHHSKPYISELMPELVIDEHIYNNNAIKLIVQLPEERLLNAKLIFPDKPLPQTLIDRALLAHLKYGVLARKQGNTDGTHAMSLDTINAPGVRLMKGIINELDAMDDAEIQSVLLEALEQYRLKGFDRFALPPTRFIFRVFDRIKNLFSHA